MASLPPQPPTGPVGPDTLITVKVIIDGNNRRFKLALRDLGAHVLPGKLRLLLAIPPEAEVKFERFSDSAGSYINLDSTNPSIYKQLYRAAKAKLKLRLKATITNKPALVPAVQIPGSFTFVEDHTAFPSSQPRSSYLQTVLSPSSHMLAHAAPLASKAQSSTSEDVKPARIPGKSDGATMQGPYQGAVRAFHQSEGSSNKDLNIMRTLFAGSFAIDCNNCGKAIPNEHYHCSICDSGDFDLCKTCVENGITCDGDSHWLIKRFQQGGNIIPSVTETIAPKKSTLATPQKTTPKDVVLEEEQEFVPETINSPIYQGERTCNSCITEFPGDRFVSCDNCPDFDLCHGCFENGEHGHHPAHIFRPVTNDPSSTAPTVRTLCEAGRGRVHDALCDGCDKVVTGIRYKCLQCPDWDFCSTCYLSAEQIHPGHRFAPLYEPLANSISHVETHHGIYCDGPLCAMRRRKSYIRGDRYKCAICHDTDFCSNCEAAPSHVHNKTHPLIKFRTPVRHISVTTLGENNMGQALTQMGDLPIRSSPRAKNAATETTPQAPSTNAATQVQTVAEVKPVETIVSETEPAEKSRTATSDLQAWFESDSTPDGSKFGPNRLVSQSWTLRNPGTHAWPAGCAVYYIGGDDMRNLDAKHPSSVSDMTAANRSNVLEHGLEPNKTAVFHVLLKSPAREGRMISYWRLKTPEGLPFGHKLWVDITVTSTSVAQPGEESTSVKKETAVEEEIKEEETSQMIFPKLEKESPMSSVHDVSAAPAVVVEPTTTTEEQELLEDVESLELEDEETDDGFMTDEEYDILDASDEDYLNEAQNAVAAKK